MLRVAYSLPAAPSPPISSCPQLCSKSCPAGGKFCHPLSDFQLRISDALLADQAFKAGLVSGAAVTACSPRGPGLNFGSAALQALAKDAPSQVSGWAAGCPYKTPPPERAPDLPTAHFLTPRPRPCTLQATSCATFRVAVPRAAGTPQLKLGDLCQQGVKIQEKGGATLYDTADAGASCL